MILRTLTLLCACSSLLYNIESPGDTCGFDQPTDQVNVSADDLKLEALADNGGPTMTHALGGDSVAIDKIPADMCEVDEDQRGFPRDSMCDVGAFGTGRRLPSDVFKHGPPRRRGPRRFC